MWPLKNVWDVVVYRSIDKAGGMIEEERGKPFNPEVVDAFIGCLDHIRSIRQQLPD
jgi:response regulator RpfG family c-di-GMP phosphodiesterase